MKIYYKLCMLQFVLLKSRSYVPYMLETEVEQSHEWFHSTGLVENQMTLRYTIFLIHFLSFKPFPQNSIISRIHKNMSLCQHIIMLVQI